MSLIVLLFIFIFVKFRLNSIKAIAFIDEDYILLEIAEIPSLGDNSFQELNLDVFGVTRLEIDFAGSGALTELDFTTV